MHYKTIKPYVQLMRLDKPIGIYLLLWPTLWALWFAARGFPSIKNLIIFIVGVILMRSAGCVINDFADRKIDLHVQRTKQRPLATNALTPKQAILTFGILCAVAFTLVLFTNTLTIKLSFFAVFFATLYPFMKRYTYLPQMFLGIAFSFSIPMAYAAEINTLPPIVWLLFVANLLWTTAYDTQYAMVDLEDDLKIGVKSTAILFGKHNALVIGTLQILAVLLLVAAGALAAMTWPYFLSLLVATGLIIYQQRLLKSRQKENYFKAFLNNHWLGCIVFIGIAVHFVIQ